MIDLNKVKDIYLYTNQVDMRMGIYKIEILLSLSFSPIEILDAVFVFVSKDRKQVKIYYEDIYGKWLLINKLSYTKVIVPNLLSAKTISKRDLELLLQGVAMIEERKKLISY